MMNWRCVVCVDWAGLNEAFIGGSIEVQAEPAEPAEHRDAGIVLCPCIVLCVCMVAH